MVKNHWFLSIFEKFSLFVVDTFETKNIFSQQSDIWFNNILYTHRESRPPCEYTSRIPVCVQFLHAVSLKCICEKMDFHNIHGRKMWIFLALTNERVCLCIVYIYNAEINAEITTFWVPGFGFKPYSFHCCVFCLNGKKTFVIYIYTFM